MREMKADALLEGPRGRRLCGEIAKQGNYAWSDPDWYELLWQERTRRYPQSTASATNSNAPPPPPRKQNLEEIVAIGEPELLWRLADSVGSAMYWQSPDDEDQMLARPEVRQALIPIAEQLLRAEAAQWWDSPLNVDRQCYVEWLDSATNGPPPLEGVSEATRSWRSRAVERERVAESWPESLEYLLTANWWSMPDISVRIQSSRALPWLGAVGLMLNEDAPNWEHARVWSLAPCPTVHVYEVTGPNDWVELVEGYPFEVTFSRRHDWWRATGRAGRWFIPDWQAVGADYDGVHLTVLGYLTTAGRALDIAIEDSATVLAGWNPDDTYWLNDVVGPASDAAPVEWQLRDIGKGELIWSPVRTER